VDVSTIHFDEDDSIHLVFYSVDDLPDIYMSLDVFEQDGSRYGVDINRDNVIKDGWNEIAIPFLFCPSGIPPMRTAISTQIRFRQSGSARGTGQPKQGT